MWMTLFVPLSLQDAFNKFVSPENVLQFSEGEVVDKAHIDNPVFDYVPPDLVTLYISNMWVNFVKYFEY